MSSTVPAQAHWAAQAALCRRIVDNVDSVLVGKRAHIELAVAAMLAGGHILIEDVPGLGKTLLARALARSFALSFHRIQFTADLLPSDIVGGPVYQPKDGSFLVRRGPVFANLVLADEINRANPRAQSAMLECMEEAQVTIDGQTLELPQPFVVLATQNPIDMAGTYPLPEAQLDRFLIRLSLGYPGPQIEAGLIAAQQFGHPLQKLAAVCDREQFARMQRQTQDVEITPEVARFIAEIVQATREHPALAFGASPRATLGLARISRALSSLRGQSYVDPAVVRELAVPVLAHRIVLKRPAPQPRSPESVVQDLLAKVSTPR